MSNYLSQVCKPRQSVFDRDRRDVVLDLLDLFEDKVDAEKFFDENFVTSGMHLLLEKTFERLENSSDQASTFVLTQSMGGGKTHNMIALGLLGKNPDLRAKVLENGLGSKVGDVRVIGFSGRESDAEFGIWGALAEQLGKKEVFNDLYSPLQAPGQSAWVNLLKGEPTLILLDELPPYLNNARAKEIGNSDLSVVTTTAISNLLVAVNKPELSNVCVVISDLAASSYGDGGDSLNESLANLQRETNRSALRIEPVSSQGDEVYHILRTRLFESVADDETIKTIANEYADAVKQAKQMDVTNASPDAYAAQIMESYPFHFSIRDLYARFKENAGFQQTRGLIRLMRIIVSSMYQTKRADSTKLIHPYDLDLNDNELFSELKSINPSLEEAITHDIANNGNSAAEQMDITGGTGGTDAQDVSKLLLVASLSNAMQATVGLSPSDIIGFLCAPGRDISRLKKEVIDTLEINLWYLHRSTDGKLFFKNTKNLAAELNGLAQSYTQESRLKELKEYLHTLFEIRQKDCYQKLEIMPASDEVETEQDKTMLVITKPTTNEELDQHWKDFFNAASFKNRVIFLSGRQETLNRVLENAAQYKAISSIIDTFESERRSQTDPQYKLANSNKDKILLQLRSSIQETFTTLFYPSFNTRRNEVTLRSADIRIEFVQNQFNGEEHIKNTLRDKHKFTVDIDSDEFRRKVEAKLFGQQKSKPWNEVKRKAATDAGWDMHIPTALDRLKDNSVMTGKWVDDGSGYINIEPPKPSTRVSVTELSSHDGEATLRIKPDHGDVVYYEYSDTVPTTASSKVEDFQNFKTSELQVTFLCVDSSGEHDTGEPYTWKNRLNLQYEVYDNGNKVKVIVKPNAEIKYTTDGSDPKTHGAVYEDDILVPDEHRFVQFYAHKNGIETAVEKVDVEPYRLGKVEFDKSKPIRWLRRFDLTNTKDSYAFIERLKKHDAKAVGFRATIQKGDTYLDCGSDQSLSLSGKDLESIISNLRAFVADSEVNISAEEVYFDRGQQLDDWAAEELYNLNMRELKQ